MTGRTTAVGAGPFARIPKRLHLRYEMEIQPYDGLRHKWKGWLVEVCRYEGSESEHRSHAWPHTGIEFNGRWPSFKTARTREKLEAKLRAHVSVLYAERERQKVERVQL